MTRERRIPEDTADYARWLADRIEEGGERSPMRLNPATAMFVGMALRGYGWLADVAIPRATALVWLDVPWIVCRAGLFARGMQVAATEQNFADLLQWAEDYWTRETSSSFAGHSRIFEKFSGAKFRLRGRGEIEKLLDDLRAESDG